MRYALIHTARGLAADIAAPSHLLNAGGDGGSGAAWAPTEEDGEGGGGGEGALGEEEEQEAEGGEALGWEERGPEFHPAVAGYKERFKVREGCWMWGQAHVSALVHTTSCRKQTSAPDLTHMYTHTHTHKMNNTRTRTSPPRTSSACASTVPPSTSTSRRSRYGVVVSVIISPRDERGIPAAASAVAVVWKKEGGEALHCIAMD